MLPEQARGPGIALPGSADKVCFIYLLDDSGSAIQSNASQPNESSSLAESTGQLNLNAAAPTSKQTCSLLVFCQMPMQPERATTWIQGLLHVVQAQHVLVIASLPVSTPKHSKGHNIQLWPPASPNSWQLCRNACHSSYASQPLRLKLHSMGCVLCLDTSISVSLLLRGCGIPTCSTAMSW